MLGNRLYHAVEGLIFSLIIVALFFIIAQVVKFLFKKNISSSKYYSAAVILGFLLYFILISSLLDDRSNESKTLSATDSNVSQVSSGLDEPFIPSKEENLEDFPLQLDSALNKLNESEKKQLIEATEFLAFCLYAHLKEENEGEFEKMTELDLTARVLTKLYRFAQENGKSMTLLKYIELADDFKKHKPTWWKQYQLYNDNEKEAKTKEYVDNEYGYAFHYPSDWKMQKVPEGKEGGKVRVLLLSSSGSIVSVVIGYGKIGLTKEQFNNYSDRNLFVEQLFDTADIEQIYRMFSRKLKATKMEVIEKKVLPSEIGIQIYIATDHFLGEGIPITFFGIHAIPFGKNYMVSFIIRTSLNSRAKKENETLEAVFNSFHLIGEHSIADKGLSLIPVK
jgi:hypothetical protein